MMRRASLMGVPFTAVLAVLGAAACSQNAGGPRSPSAPMTHGVSEAPPVAPAPEWMVWTREKDPKTHADILRTARIDGAGRMLSETDGIVLALDGEMWRFDRLHEDLKLGACSDEEAPRDSSVETARLVRVDSKQDIRSVLPSYIDETRGGDGSGNVIEMGAVQQHLEVSGSIGPYLFVREHTWLYGCGAHGMWSASPHVIDARTGEAVSLDVADASSPASLARAMDRFVRADIGAPADVVPSDAQYVATEPRFSGSQMGFVHIYIAGVPYTFGTTEWSSYAIDTELPAPLPKVMADDAVAPPSVVRFASASPQRTIGGWTKL